MKLPEIGPDIRAILDQGPGILNEIAKSDEANTLISRANDEYWPWEDFKYKTQHLTFTPEDLWAFLKFFRNRSAKALPLRDVRGMRFRYWLPDGALEDLHRIDHEVGGRELFGGISLLPEAKDQYLISSLMEEAIASSQIEGAATTRLAAKEMLRKNLKPRDRSERSILNNYQTILAIKDTLADPMSVELLNNFQMMLTKDTLDDPAAGGRLRRDDEPILVVDHLDGQILHTPPPASSLPEQMGHLCELANNDNGRPFVHPVVRAIILHFWLAYLHPYVDGNGRTARALFYWQMLRSGYWPFEYLSISRVILQTRVQYLKAFLHAERDDGDVTYFIVYHLRAIRQAIRELQEYLKRKQAQSREAVTLLKGIAWMNYRQRALLQHALRNPDSIYTIESHRHSHNVTYQTARTDLLTLAEKGYLKKFKSGRTFHFLVPADLSERVGRVEEG